ncbi:hypothetical protein HER10_EVM0006875 [Colletotrichum scovillei]|uniref:uncharacterized protein n=1 Tax=Colletotrichum scovillei TaxID=1209932 RepID=UPI0015C2E3C0|nr:uncharacterized protein HER10_EVM0006875 [Colletotrichum scovillei]KAF4776539.1 hypothetical protein HER10_EVM0006875 [Colletotrichum scovillei]
MSQLVDYNDSDEDTIPAGTPSDNAIPRHIQQHSEIDQLSQDLEKTRQTSAHLDKMLNKFKEVEKSELSRLKGEGIDVPTVRLVWLDLNYKICQMEEDLLALRETSREINSEAAAQEHIKLKRCRDSLGQTMFQKRSHIIENLDVAILWGPYARTIAQGMETYYGRFDKYQTKPLRTSNRFRNKALVYYRGYSYQHQAAEISRTDTEMADFLAESYQHYWCHATGSWMFQETREDKRDPPAYQCHAAANIVPHFSNVPHEILEDLFGERERELSGPANSLLLSMQIQYWFNHYKLVIVPVDPEEKPLKRWKIDILDKDIEDIDLHAVRFTPGGKTPRFAKSLQDRELVFLNDKRPAARFLYFHFIMALIRLKDTKSESWKDARAKYLSRDPSPSLLHFLPL